MLQCLPSGAMQWEPAVTLHIWVLYCRWVPPGPCQMNLDIYTGERGSCLSSLLREFPWKSNGKDRGSSFWNVSMALGLISPWNVNTYFWRDKALWSSCYLVSSKLPWKDCVLASVSSFSKMFSEDPNFAETRIFSPQLLMGWRAW